MKYVSGQKLRIILVIVLLASAGLLAAVVYMRNRQPVVIELNEATQAALAEGECSDADRDNIAASAESQQEPSQEVARYTDLAYCFAYRQDYEQAINAYEKAEALHRQLNADDQADQIANVIETLRRLKDLPDTVEDGDPNDFGAI